MPGWAARLYVAVSILGLWSHTTQSHWNHGSSAELGAHDAKCRVISPGGELIGFCSHVFPEEDEDGLRGGDQRPAALLGLPIQRTDPEPALAYGDASSEGLKYSPST